MVLRKHRNLTPSSPLQHRQITTMPSQYQADDDNLSIASTLVPSDSASTSTPRAEEPRTTLTGRPIKYEHDSLSNTVSGESFYAVPNTLPPGYTDKSLVHIPIKTALYLPPATQPETVENDVKRSPPRKGSAFSRLSSKLQNGIATNNSDADGMKIVAMSRGDYLRYWAKGADGNFKDNVVEPPEGRAKWLANALERQEREGLGKPTMQRTKGTYSRAAVVDAAGALIGSLT
jgi:hypothetical protein